MRIKDMFFEKDFRIVKVKYEYNSPSKDIIIFVKGHEYQIKYQNLQRFLIKFDISLDEELYSNHYPIERLDNRPLYKKAMDSQMGKKVNFNNSKNYISIDEIRLERLLKK